MGTNNVLILMSDQHAAGVMGAYGNAVAETPNLDDLAQRSVVFEAAYTPSPICVPARASFATGRYAHDTANWDNAAPYTGHEAASWATRLEDAGIPVTTFGKLHYRSPEDPTGFRTQRNPLHVKNGVGDLTQLLRGDQPPTPALREVIEDAGPGESSYTRYDRDVAADAAAWLRERGAAVDPWCAVVSLVSPHYPLTAPEEFYRRFAERELPASPGEDEADWDMHPVTAEYRMKCCLDEPLTADTIHRAKAAYYALVSFMDEQMGLVLTALAESGQAENTTVIYLSDHGESLGAHGIWFKSTLHETAVRVPMIYFDPRSDQTGTRRTPASLVDIFPTVLEQFGIPISEADADVRGTSLAALAEGPEDYERPIFSEYHAVHSRAASMSLRRGRWKLHYHVGAPARLFDLESDPDEMHDLAGTAENAAVLERLIAELRELVDPELLDQRVKQNQADRMAAGGRDFVLANQMATPYTPVPGAA